VSALLGGIFADEPEVTSCPVATGTDTLVLSVAGLDSPHSTLLRLLAGRNTWTRAELEHRCAELKLLPDGAIDRLNEAAYDAAGDPLVEGEDPIDINTEVAQEMLA
jgi:hypothetical protein